MMSAIDTENEVSPVCPYCGNGGDRPGDFDGVMSPQERRMTCDECGKDFLYTVTETVDYWFQSQPIKEEGNDDE